MQILWVWLSIILAAGGLLVGSTLILTKLIRYFLERSRSRSFIERLENTRWRIPQSDQSLILLNDLLVWPAGVAWARFGDNQPYRFWSQVDQSNGGVLLNLYVGHVRQNLPPRFTIYFPSWSKVEWRVDIGETPQQIMDTTPHVRFVLTKPVNDTPYYLAA